MTEDLFSLGYLSNSLKTLILNIIVPLCTPKSTTNLTNFLFSRNRLKTIPWWYATDIMPFLFVLRISSYFLIRSAVSSGLSNIPACSLSSSVSKMLLLTRESTSCFFISSWLSRSVFLSFSKPFHSYKQKITVIP